MDALVTALDADAVRALPKVELHVHLEGTFSGEAIATMADASGVALPRPTARLFEFTDLTDFLGFLDWTCTLVATPAAAAQVAYDHARRSAADGIVRSEVIINPTHWPHWDLGELVAALTAGFDRAADEGLTDCHLLLSVLRGQSTAEALALVEWIGAHRPRRVVGVSIDGDEARSGRTGPRFAPAFTRARELGIHRTAHAGESSGAEGVIDALDLLHVERIDHGVRAADDPALIERLAATGTTLNACVTSNLVHLYPDLDAHPVATLRAAGVRITLNTDDPGYLGIDLTGELLRTAGHHGWTLHDLAALQANAIDAAFCDEATRAALHRRLADHLAAHVTGHLTGPPSDHPFTVTPPGVP